MCRPARVWRGHRLTVTMGMGVPMTGVTEAASMPITLNPVMMTINVRQVIAVPVEAVRDLPSAAMTETAARLTPVIP